MRVNGCELMAFINETKGAVPAFGAVNMEGIHAIINAAEAYDSPVILQMTEGGIKYAGLETLYAIAKIKAEQSKAKISIHLDHGRDLDLIKAAIDLGFDSVMYDGSYLPIDENIANAKIIKDYIGDKKIALEVEVGAIGGKEDGMENKDNNLYANIDDVIKINEEVNPDLIAVAFGTSHGIYHGEIKINYDLITQALAKTGKPIVMHGTSGVDDEVVAKCINLGVRKVNYDTILKQNFIQAIIDYHQQDQTEYDIRKIFTTAMIRQQKVAEDIINLCEE